MEHKNVGFFLVFVNVNAHEGVREDVNMSFLFILLFLFMFDSTIDNGNFTYHENCILYGAILNLQSATENSSVFWKKIKY